MENLQEQNGMIRCPHCGYLGTPVQEPLLRKRDWIIFACTFWFGFGIVYIILEVLMKFLKFSIRGRKLICRGCKRKLSAEKVSKEEMKQTAKSIVNNKELRNAVGDLKNSLHDLHKSNYIR